VGWGQTVDISRSNECGKCKKQPREPGLEGMLAKQGRPPLGQCIPSTVTSAWEIERQILPAKCRAVSRRAVFAQSKWPRFAPCDGLAKT
jgi:hypothetical protein